MSLYRKHRPASFGDVIGQEQVVSVLEKQIKNSNINHAYLFSGSRGTGKTSVARIFARAIGTQSTDLYEIDGASNNGVDEVRELREAVQTLPFQSKYKVYIIDEVHMLSKAAFNALLKTLEEPPAYVVFVLATTEKNKLPETIISRCQNFSFKKPHESDVRELLILVAKKEEIELDKGSLALIALLAEGSYRDALTILDKVLAVSKDKRIFVHEVEKITGAPSSVLVNQFLEALVTGDKKKAIGVIKDATDSHADMRVFTKLILRSARFAMLLVLAADMREFIKNEISDEELVFLGSLGKGLEAKKLPNILRALLKAYQEISVAYIQSLPLELIVAELPT
ncbi:MAG TPA: DNA polymerase III subunit gamma/tau [Candidatus Paceibacterota bacterium]